MGWVKASNCAPETKTVNYLKKNLLYCFEAGVRQQLKDKMEAFELEFFVGKKKNNPPTNQQPAQQ
jgi:hypothetical protein